MTKAETINYQTGSFFLLPKSFAAPLDILLEVTKQCNLSCNHCFNESGNLEDSIDKVAFNHLVNQIINLQPITCCFSGGEPFLFPDIVLSSAVKMRESGILTSAVSNGWFISNKLLPKLIDSFYGMQVSLDGASDKTHDKIRNKKGSFQHATTALKLLVGKITSLQVAFVVNSLNYNEINALLLLLSDIGITHLVIQPIVQQGKAITTIILHYHQKCYSNLLNNLL